MTSLNEFDPDGDFVTPLFPIDEPNDTIPQAIATDLSSANPGNFFLSNRIGNNPNVASTADVDIYELQLDAGDRVTIDIDTREFGSSLDSILRLFDSTGNEVAVSDDTPAPGEPFTLDSFIDFTATATDNYYIGVSGFANFGYNPFTEGSGSGSGTGTYDIDINIAVETIGDEAILGTDNSESLFGDVGDDTIFGKGGNDQIFGSEGMNTLYGGAGDDTMYGGSQADTMYGGSGNDAIFAAEGENIVFGGLGDDTMYGGSQADEMYGGFGNDLIFAAEGDNIVFGGVGDDTIYTGSGNDKIDGGFGNDIIWLGGGQDIIFLEAGKGIDTINNFQLGQTTFDISGNTSELSIVDGANGAEISQFGELLAVVSWKSASTFIDNIDTIFV
ncbi:calcium-binding protein [Rivularia sp. UHCC 0363]|uniref:calcium-binding protein n=1 Tax=Rivularia sp. UHCC 0363 TaxID=3110244 RepID=UPI002B21BA56|nr:pre-peptidase C-terminal domain-containing protein [Rivularia sp. UHCC 0363]MEA5598657.1 pre-peptidase C-terminal domain-containing protein [Rivularia sp. UHCC 0363]